MEICNTISFCKALQIPRRALRVHRLRAAFLRENKPANSLLALLYAELTQQRYYLWIYVDRATPAVLGCVQVYTFAWRIAEVSTDCYCAIYEINVFPL